MRGIFGSGRYANVTATIALIIALGGSAYAAGVFPKGSVGSAQIKKSAVKGKHIASNAVTASKVKDGTLESQDFKPGSLPVGMQGPAGPTGDPGAPGAPGAPATKLFAAVSSTGVLGKNSGAASSRKLGPGEYEVVFNQDIASCVYLATVGEDGASRFPAMVSTTRTAGTSNAVRVRFTDDLGAAADKPFYLGVFC